LKKKCNSPSGYQVNLFASFIKKKKNKRMIICNDCKTELKNNNNVLCCNICGKEILSKNDILIFNPEIKFKHEDYDAESLNNLYKYEKKHFWFAHRNKIIATQGFLAGM